LSPLGYWQLTIGGVYFSEQGIVATRKQGRYGKIYQLFYESSRVFKNTKAKPPASKKKVRSKRINLEGNTHAQEINVSQCPV
jgi:hypothetical protein